MIRLFKTIALSLQADQYLKDYLKWQMKNNKDMHCKKCSEIIAWTKRQVSRTSLRKQTRVPRVGLQTSASTFMHSTSTYWRRWRSCSETRNWSSRKREGQFTRRTKGRRRSWRRASDRRSRTSSTSWTTTRTGRSVRRRWNLTRCPPMSWRCWRRYSTRWRKSALRWTKRTSCRLLSDYIK